MPANPQLPNPEKSSWIRAMLPPVVAGVVLIGALTAWTQWETALLAPGGSTVYRMHNSEWQKLPAAPGVVDSLRVSAQGAVWATIWHGRGHKLARLDGASWLIYKEADVGWPSVSTFTGFVLDGEDVWVAAENGVLHWDSKDGTVHREVPAGKTPASMAAAGGEVWGIDSSGNLSHFAAGQWKVQKAELPGAKWDDPDRDFPEIARTEDGTLWIVNNGVWRYDGAAWTPVDRDGGDWNESNLVGTAGDGIWLWDGEYVSKIGVDGEVSEFDPADMGLSSRESVAKVVEAGGRIYVTTTSGMLRYDGDAWRRVPLPQDGVRSLSGLSMGPAGEVWAIGNHPPSRWMILAAWVPIVLLVAILAVPVWMVRRFKRHKLQVHQRLQQAVAHATGAVPEEFARDERLLVKQSSWWSAIVAVGVIVGAMVGYSITRRFWLKAPSWMFLVIAVALHAAATLGQSLVKKTPKPWDPIEPGGPQFDWAPTWKALPGSLIVFVLMNMTEVSKWIGDPVLWVLYGIMAVTWYRAIEQTMIAKAINSGDYERGLKVVRWFHLYDPEGGAALIRRGHLLLLAGRYREGEQMLRRAVAGLRSRSAQASALEFLGDALLEQERTDEAMRNYEAALHASAGFRRPYRGMAELLLRQGRDPVRALEYVESIVGPSGPSWNRWTINGNAKDDYWSLKAWAMAELGRTADMAGMMEQAIKNTNPKSRPDLAATHWRLGMAMQAMDRPADAEAHWRKARDARRQRADG